MDTNVTLKVADFIENFSTKSSGIEGELKAQVRKLFLDFLSVTIVGSKSPVSQKLFSYLKTGIEEQGSIVIGHNSRTIYYKNAAFINGTSAHALDFDDGYTQGSVHIGSVVFPTVLAMAEKNKNSSEEIFRAIIVGYEVIIRVASMIHPYSREHGYHNTTVAGIFGAVGVVSSLLKLNKEQIIGALGNALSFTSGTFAFLHSGSDIKRLHPGIAAFNGITATELAKHEILGPENIFERNFGLFDVFSNRKFNKSENEKSWDEPLGIFDAYIKTYPCCRQLDSTINAIKKIKSRALINPSDIKRIEVRTHYLAAEHNQKNCTNFIDAQMSIPYAIAVSIIDEVITPESFHINRSKKELINDIKSKVEVYKDEDFEGLYPPIRKSEVTIYKKDNEVLVDYSDKSIGEPSSELSFDNIVEKFKNNCQNRLTDKTMEEVVKNVYELKFLKAVNF